MQKKSEQTRSFILYPKKNIEEVRACVLENYGQIKYELPFLNALCVEVPKERIRTIRTNRRIAMIADDIGVSKLTAPFPYSQTGIPPTSPASDFHSAIVPPFVQHLSYGADPRPTADKTLARFQQEHGANVAIAIIDTGVVPHYDLTKPYDRIAAFHDFINDKTRPYDDDGHGTHVAGIAAGNGYASAGKYTGMAPQSTLVCLKALDKDGNGNASDILAAMQWIYDHHRKYGIRVVNLSLGIHPFGRSSDLDPLELGANILSNCGLTVIAAAGNSGPSRYTITSPGTSSLVLTVGASDRHNHVAAFSSRGPAPGGLLKPDVVAPGVNITSLSSKNYRGYLTQSGTSMSAPYVSGLAAAYYSLCPDTTPEEMRRFLLSHAVSIPREPRMAQGHGLLKCAYRDGSIHGNLSRNGFGNSVRKQPIPSGTSLKCESPR